jgi:hypothetical protein
MLKSLIRGAELVNRFSGELKEDGTGDGSTPVTGQSHKTMTSLQYMVADGVKKAKRLGWSTEFRARPAMELKIRAHGAQIGAKRYADAFTFSLSHGPADGAFAIGEERARFVIQVQDMPIKRVESRNVLK